jgi:hypothetical protein
MFRSEFAKRLCLVIASIILGLALFGSMSLFHLIDYRALVSRLHGDWFASTNLTDRELLHIHPAYLRLKGSTRGGNFTAGFQIPRSDMAEYHWDLRYDRNGFRNDRDLAKADLAVIGDSFVESMTTPTSELLTSRLGFLEGQVSVNLGQYGYGPAEELAVLRRYALPLHPKTVVWMFSESSDLNDLIHWHQDARRSGAPAGPPPLPASQGSFLQNRLTQIRTHLTFAFRPSGASRMGTLRTATGQAQRVYFLYPNTPLTAVQADAFKETTEILGKAQQLCVADGVHMVFAFIPTKFRALRNLCEFPRESECRNWSLSDLPQRFQEAVGKISPEMGFIDLTPYLTAASRAGNRPFYPDDDHWTPAGEKAAAEAIHHYLASEGTAAAGTSR